MPEVSRRRENNRRSRSHSPSSRRWRRDSKERSPAANYRSRSPKFRGTPKYCTPPPSERKRSHRDGPRHTRDRDTKDDSERFRSKHDRGRDYERKRVERVQREADLYLCRRRSTSRERRRSSSRDRYRKDREYVSREREESREEQQKSRKRHKYDRLSPSSSRRKTSNDHRRYNDDDHSRGSGHIHSHSKPKSSKSSPDVRRKDGSKRCDNLKNTNNAKENHIPHSKLDKRIEEGDTLFEFDPEASTLEAKPIRKTIDSTWMIPILARFLSSRGSMK